MSRVTYQSVLRKVVKGELVKAEEWLIFLRRKSPSVARQLERGMRTVAKKESQMSRLRERVD